MPVAALEQYVLLGAHHEEGANYRKFELETSWGCPLGIFGGLGLHPLVATGGGGKVRINCRITATL